MYIQANDKICQQTHTVCTMAYHDWLGAIGADDSDLLREHAQFLKVHQAVHLCLVAVIEEGQVLLDDGEEGDEGWGGVAL